MSQPTPTAAGTVNRPWINLGIFAGVLTLLFAKTMVDLARHALSSDLHSHALLIPLISVYLGWQKRGEVRTGSSPGSQAWAALFALGGLAALAAHWVLMARGWQPRPNDVLCLTVFAYLSLLAAGVFVCLGARAMRTLSFPWAFLVFMIPLPTAAVDAIEVFFQHASAEAAYLLIAASGTPILRTGLEFDLPGISIRVGQECSGIRSSLVLFITSLLAGHMLLRTQWRRAILAAAVIPLGIIRNGFRIFTLAILCVHVDVDIINSPLHHRGGPLFFALSLVPFLALVAFLRYTERPRVKPN